MSKLVSELGFPTLPKTISYFVLSQDNINSILNAGKGYASKALDIFISDNITVFNRIVRGSGDQMTMAVRDFNFKIFIIQERYVPIGATIGIDDDNNLALHDEQIADLILDYMYVTQKFFCYCATVGLMINHNDLKFDNIMLKPVAYTYSIYVINNEVYRLPVVTIRGSNYIPILIDWGKSTVHVEPCGEIDTHELFNHVFVGDNYCPENLWNTYLQLMATAFAGNNRGDMRYLEYVDRWTRGES